MIKKINSPWKLAFFSLVAFLFIVILLSLSLLTRIFPAIEDKPFHVEHGSLEEGHFTITTTRENLNRVIASKVNESPYSVQLTESSVLFQSNISVLGRSIPIEMRLLPEVVEGGNIVLKVDSLSVAVFQLPSDQILQLIDNHGTLPEWVQIYPVEQLVYVDMGEVGKAQGLAFQFIEFDLQTDQFELEMSIR
ncbi:YpmS family protein [Bacillus sp. FJAT-45350]|uniref:YpmS family protein n=1 Tax=Bacillus sp. FJAT-45350 TaxID=2011014 RepID=UPI0015CE106A|nr:YpmS family protein [Bacillus sp. FJAT-45350]